MSKNNISRRDFGPKKLPELGRPLGSTLKEFKQSTKGIMDDEHDKEK
ncbi:twin-arginine translocase TatA/TatE family subunit [Bacillus sp. AFS073361]|nr:twin-arginine translocase TatA/TatE family subunit [Bacillus sp. AFS073361]PFP27627.1 twin-arginine translocase TatA/TatE family subunit [Bacillus sp. AFS073361]